MSFCVLVHAVFLPLLALAQYPGQVTKTPDPKAPPTLRAISVYEWTGDLAKPTASRLIPVMVYDGEKMQDATVYLARPEPLALAPEVEYELQVNGRKVMLFDVKNAALVEGEWVGLGAPKPLPKPKPSRSRPQQVKVDDFGESDRPVLHRKHPASATSGSTPSSSTSDSNGSTTAAPDDPDRPRLHRAPSATNSSANSSAGTGTADSSSGSSTAAANDPDRPQLHRPKPKPAETGSSSSDFIDPDRPRLRHGETGNFQLAIIPGLKGLPADLSQAVAVSDAVPRTEHVWNFGWSNPDDADKLKTALKQIARDALGMTPPPALKSKSARPGIKKTPPPAEPLPLADENFRAFELAYNSGATLVLTANNGKTGSELKYVTLIAQPDLYGNPLIVFKQVTDAAHLDTNPRMRLIDAVDALADNRGELLFELRTTDDRQFALYRVLRGTADRIFVSGGNPEVAGQ